MTDLLLHNARLIDPARGIDATGHIAVTDRVITAAGTGEPDKASMKAAWSMAHAARKARGSWIYSESRTWSMGKRSFSVCHRRQWAAMCGER